MIRTCPKCGDYYADALLAFCLADGTPLVNVDTRSESWSEGTRVIEEKENALRTQKRKLKWRRVVMRAMTTLIATMVVCVVAVNSFIYLKPKPEEVVLNKPSTPETTSVEATDSTTPNAPDEPASTPSPTLEAESPATPIPSQTPILIRTPTPTPTPTPVCSDAEKSRARESIIRRFKSLWQNSIERDHNEILARAMKMGIGNVEPTLVPIKPKLEFSKTCERADVTVNYEWRLTPRFNGLPNFNGLPRAEVSMKGTKSFICNRTGEAWHCP